MNIYQTITNRIIEQLEKGVVPWRKPWKISGTNIKGANDLKKLAFNRISKTAYSPLNQMLLTRAGEYASFKQWQDLGGKIKKGAKAEIVVFWKMQEYIDTEHSTAEPERSSAAADSRLPVPVPAPAADTSWDRPAPGAYRAPWRRPAIS